MSKSIRLDELCLRMNSMWQYIDIKLNGSLSSIMTNQKCPSDIMFLSDQQLSSLANGTCTIYTVVREFQDSGKVATSKNFFDNYTEKTLTHIEKENIYWRIRLRYGCGIIPVAVVHMISKLRECGYTDWMLPNSMTIPLDDLYIVTFVVIPNNIHIIKSVKQANGQIFAGITEAIENFGDDFGEGLPIEHTVLGAVLSSGEKYVVDPTSLQFGVRGEHSKLIYSGSWDAYCQIFPGHHITLLREGFVKNINEVELLYEIGNHGFGHIDELVEKSLEKLYENSCSHCGELQGENVTLSRCSRCKKVYYCDKFCQKSNWKFHKTHVCVCKDVKGI